MSSEQADSPLENNAAATEASTEEQILFWCPECGQKYRLPKGSAGETGICFKCKAYLFIPSKSQEKPVQTKMIVFACAHCGSKQRKARKLAGTEIKCIECGEKNIVPEKSKISSLAKDGDEPKDRILFWCRYCGQKYRLPKHLSGKSANCDRCHNAFIIPDKTQTKPTLKETTVFPCEHCGQKQWKTTEQAGEEIECKKCGKKSIVPSESKISPLTKTETDEKSRIFLWCCHCGQKYRLPREMAGKIANCDKCQKDFLIPMESQVKPERKESVIFPCEHCGKKIKKTKDIAGTQINCRECGRENTVPEKSKKSLFDLIASREKNDPFITAEATKMNLKLPPRMTQTNISTEEAAPVEINFPKKKVSAETDAESKKRPIKIFPKTEEATVEKAPIKGVPVEPKVEKTQSKIKLASKPAPDKTKSATKIFLKTEDTPLKIYPETDINIIFWCGYCKQKYRLPNNLAGRKSICDNCKNNLFIPSISQTKPEFKDTIVFPCKHCKKKLWKAQELIGKEILCHECGGENTVPKKSDKSLFHKKAPVKLQNASIAHEVTKTNMIIVGKAPVDPDAPEKKSASKKSSKKKFKSRVVYNTDPIVEKEEIPKLSNKEDYTGPQIIITEDPPTIHKIKNYFQRKAEKYFIFAMFVLFIDYLINTYDEGRRPSKTFILFATFTIAAIILLLTWNYITYVPPNKTSKCRYNTMCTSAKCNLSEIRRLGNIANGTCSKCSARIGLTYRCRHCNKSFVYDEVQCKKELKAKNIKDAKRRAKWYGKKIKVKGTLFNNRIIKKCSNCNSEDVYYVTVKEAEKAAEQAAIEKEFQKEAAKKEKRNKKKKTKKKK